MPNMSEQRYRELLKSCGFRSWKRANRRRGELIDRDIDGTATVAEREELERLQALADAYLDWKAPRPTAELERIADELERKLMTLFGGE